MSQVSVITSDTCLPTECGTKIEGLELNYHESNSTSLVVFRQIYGMEASELQPLHYIERGYP
jgi:hypothetical protein